MNWTDQQKNAIDTRDRSIIVSAAAGSGKTAVLVERLLKILADPSPDTRVAADEIIVVTFTKDAAAQMKQRLARKITETLDEMNQQGRHQEAAYDWLIQQRSALSSAKISTIHSFCFDFIRENADACGVSSQFSIAEPAREYVFKKRALQSVLESWTKNRETEIKLLFNYFCIREDAELEKFILLTANYLNSLAFPDYWIKQAQAFCQGENACFFNSLKQTFLEGIQECITLAEQSRTFAVDAFDCPGDRKYEIVLNDDIARFQAQQNYICNADKSALLTDPLKYQIIKFKPFPGGKKNADYYREEEKEIFGHIRDIYKEKYTALIKGTLVPLTFWKEDSEIQKQVIPLLLELTQEYQTALFQEKKEQNVLSFDDAEHLVLGLLGTLDENGILHRSELAESFARKYQLIMIDEYQDSNDKQDCLFKLLSQECRISEDGRTLHYGTNAFLVGDVKQSIYRFRQANPENFRKAIQDSTPLANCKGHEMSRIYLNQNFRSAPDILDFINDLFRNVMSEKCGELFYTQDEQLNFGAADYLKLDKKYQGVQVIIPKSSADSASEDLQADCAADTIASMIAQQFPVMQDGSIRPCEYKDFCILLRSPKKHVKPIAEAFKKRNLPFAFDEDDGFLTLPEIQLMTNLLRVIDNPMTDVAVAGVLLSPVYGFTPEDLAMLKVSGDGRRIYLQMQTISEQEDSVLFRKCHMFLEQLAQMRSLADTMPLEQFLYEIYEMTDFMSLQSLYEHADERREHLEIFAEYALSYREHADLTAQSSLSGWLRYLDYLRESGEKFSANLLSQKANYVSVKTIHKSKGLEYPFVFLLHSERQFNKRPTPPPVLPAENGILGLQMIDRKRCVKITSGIYQYLQYQQNKKEKSEEMRLLYVALTRAKQKLFLVTDNIHTGCSPKNHICNMGGVLESYAVRELAPEMNSMQDWLLAYLLSSDEADYLRKAMDEGKSVASSMAEYQVWTAGKTAESQAAEKIIVSAEPDGRLVSQIREQLSWQYTSYLTELPAKRTVTSLSHPETGMTEQIQIPEFMLEDEEGRIRRLHGAARGTAIHKIMQFMDFQAAVRNPEQEIQRMLQADILEPVEAQAMQPEKIRAFFDSALYQRIAASDSVLKEKQLFVQIGKLHLPESSMLLQNYLDTDGIMIGTVDLLFHEPDGWVIVDYKTDHVQHDSELTKKYAVQLGLYQKAMELVLNAPVKQAYIYSFALDKAIKVRLDEIHYA